LELSVFRAIICNVYGAQESIPPGWDSIPGLLKRFTNTGSGLEKNFGGRGTIQNLMHVLPSTPEYAAQSYTPSFLKHFYNSFVCEELEFVVSQTCEQYNSIFSPVEILEIKFPAG
jgi:hypothetical protein